MEKQQHTEKSHTKELTNIAGILILDNWRIAPFRLKVKNKALSVLAGLSNDTSEYAIRIDIVWNSVNHMPTALKKAIQENDKTLITQFVIEDKLNNPHRWRKIAIKQFHPGIKIFENWTREIRHKGKHIGRIFLAKAKIEDPEWFVQ